MDFDYETQQRYEEIRKRHRQQLQKGEITCKPSPAAIWERMVSTSHTNAKLETLMGEEDCQEDHWNSSYTRDHCQTQHCHYPGYQY